MKGFKGTISSDSPPNPAVINIIAMTLGLRLVYSQSSAVLHAQDSDAAEQLAAFWQARGDDAPFDQCIGHYRKLINAQVQCARDMHVIDADAANSLTAWASETSSTQVHSVTVTDSDGHESTLHGVYVFGTPEPAPSESPPYQPENLVWLWTPAKGIEQFPTLGAMTRKLLARLGESSQGAALLPYPLTSEGADHGSATLAFNAVQSPWAEHVAGEMVRYQRSLFSDALADGGAPALKAAGQLKALNDGFEGHLRELMRFYHTRTLPDWLRLASADERDAYQAAEAALSAAQQAYDTDFKKFGCYQAYACHEITAFMTAELSIDADPETITVDTRFQIARAGSEVTASKRMTLVEFGLQELTQEHLQIDVEPGVAAQGITPEVLWKMHTQLELRLGYHGALKQHYSEPALLERLAHVLGLRLALTSLASRYQHRADDSMLGPIELARAVPDDALPADLKVGIVEVNKRAIPLRDLLVFGVGDGEDPRLMLYAPGSPAGHDIFVFAGLRQLNLEINAWVRTEAGRRYLTAQVPVAYRARTRRGLESLARRSGGALLTTLAVQWFDESSFNDAMLRFAKNKAGVHLDEYSDLTPAWYRKADVRTRVDMAVIDRRLSWLRPAFAKSSQYKAFNDFARQDVQAKLDALVERHGVDRRHDCDKIIIHYEPHGDVSLLRAAMDDLRFDTPFVLGRISSSVGHSVSRLPYASVLRIAEEAHLANRYIGDMRARFLDPSTTDYAERLDLFFDITQAEMKRACLSQTAAGELTEEHKAWLVPIIDGLGEVGDLDEPDAPNLPRKPDFTKSGIYRLGIERRCVWGVYVFRHVTDDGSQQDLLYTPQAPDGLWFRPLDELRDGLANGKLGDYLYNRVRYTDQRTIGSLLQRWKDSQYPVHLIVPACEPHSHVSVWRNEFVERIQGVIKDVDDSTVTAAERVSELLESLVLNILTIVVAPFPPAAMALTIALTARSLIRGVQAYQDGDRAAAFWHFIDVVHGVTSITMGRDLLKETVAKALFKGFSPAPLVRLIDEMDILVTTELTNFLKTQISEGDE